jgi:hypothetical protein
MFGSPPASPPKYPGPVDELKIALDNRAFEIQLFWQRSNYFLILMSALGVGTFSVKDTLLAPAIAAFAALCSYLWFRVNLGSKFWQESWEVEVNLLAKERGIRAFERPMREVREQVRQSLTSGWNEEKHSWLQRWIDSETTKKFSATYHMILLSLFSSILWSSVAILLFTRLALPPTTTSATSSSLVIVQSGSLSIVQSQLPSPSPAER